MVEYCSSSTIFLPWSYLLFLCTALDNSLCDQARCPRVWCGPNLQYIPEGECCPICPPEPSISFSPIITNPGCTENGTHYSEGETWKRDPCVTCTCEAGLPLCTSMQCFAPPCEEPVWLPDQCCPVCLSQAFVPSVSFVPPNTNCEYDGQVFGDGDRWQPPNEPCKTCFCEQGETLCMSAQCAPPDCENPVYSPDTCCPTCPGNVFNVNHYVCVLSMPYLCLSPSNRIWWWGSGWHNEPASHRSNSSPSLSYLLKCHLQSRPNSSTSSPYRDPYHWTTNPPKAYHLQG